jgi:hypothetical protein
MVKDDIPEIFGIIFLAIFRATDVSLVSQIANQSTLYLPAVVNPRHGGSVASGQQVAKIWRRRRRFSGVMI